MVRTKAAGFKYRSDREVIEDALADLGGGNFYKPKEGVKNVVRILPPYNDSGKYFYEAKLHYGFKKEGKTISIPHVPNGYIEKKLNELASEGEEGAKLARRYGVRTKFYVNVIDRETGQLKIWGFSKKIMTQLNSFYKDDEDGGQFDDPDNGFDVIIERTGKGLDTKYEIRFRAKSTPAIPPGEEPPGLFDLEAETSKEFTNAELKEIWNETFAGAADTKAPPEDDDDIIDDEPLPAKKRKVDDEDADEDLKAEDEEPTTAKRRTRQVEDDDDDDEPPVRKRRAVVEDEPAPKTRTRVRR